MELGRKHQKVVAVLWKEELLKTPGQGVAGGLGLKHIPWAATWAWGGEGQEGQGRSSIVDWWKEMRVLAGGVSSLGAAGWAG